MGNGTNITENFFAPQNTPHTAKLGFCGVSKHSPEIDKKTLFGVKITKKEAKIYP